MSIVHLCTFHPCVFVSTYVSQLFFGFVCLSVCLSVVCLSDYVHMDCAAISIQLSRAVLFIQLQDINVQPFRQELKKNYWFMKVYFPDLEGIACGIFIIPSPL